MLAHGKTPTSTDATKKDSVVRLSLISTSWPATCQLRDGIGRPPCVTPRLCAGGRTRACNQRPEPGDPSESEGFPRLLDVVLRLRATAPATRPVSRSRTAHGTEDSDYGAR